MSRTGPSHRGPGPDPDDDQPIDRTVPYRAGDDAAQPPPPPADVPHIPGITINYEIARGGMGVVYGARQDFLDRRVAVKLLSRDLVGEKFAQRFRREAKILAGIKHPHIVACHSAGTTDDGQSYLVMEFVDGPDLKSWIHEHGPVPCAPALRLTKALAQALSHAHQLDVIHRDVKPENILLESVTSTAIDVSFPFVPKLVDLGLARMTKEVVGFGLTSPGSVMGTPSTMSPEQFDDPDSVDFRTDIYGLGCVLYEMLVGVPAYRGTKMTEIVARKRRPIGPNPCDENSAVPAEVGALVCSMLAAERDERPHSYKDLEQRIDALLAKLPSITSPGSRPERTQTGLADMAKTRPSNPVPPTAPNAPPPPAANKGTAGPGGPGLLRTAELDFLQEGLGAPQRTAFQDGGAASKPPAETVPASATAAAPNAPAIAPPLPPPSKKRGAAVFVVGAFVLAGAGAAWFALHGGHDPAGGGTPSEVPAKNSPPVAEIVGPEQAQLMRSVAIEVKATDSDGDRLTYQWAGPDEVTFRNEVKNTVQVMVVDGLPGEKVVITCNVGDGRNRAVAATKTLTIDEADFPKRQFLLGFKQAGAKWALEPPEGAVPVWTWVDDKPQGYVSCRSLGQLRTMVMPMGDEAFWRVDGMLGTRVDDKAPDVYGEAIVRVELGDAGHSLHCKRVGEDGENWSIELRKCKRVGGVWYDEAMAPPRIVAWTAGENAKDDPWAELSITRRRETMVFRYGRFAEKKAEAFEIAIPTDAAAPRIALSVNGGAGEFRGFTLW